MTTSKALTTLGALIALFGLYLPAIDSTLYGNLNFFDFPLEEVILAAAILATSVTLALVNRGQYVILLAIALLMLLVAKAIWVKRELARIESRMGEFDAVWGSGELGSGWYVIGLGGVVIIAGGLWRFREIGNPPAHDTDKR